MLQPACLKPLYLKTNVPLFGSFGVCFAKLNLAVEIRFLYRFTFLKKTQEKKKCIIFLNGLPW